MVTSFPKHKIKIALFEKIHPAAVDALQSNGYSVELYPNTMDGEELKKVVADVHCVGSRSRTKFRKDILSAAPKLMAVGCFMVGTDNVDLSHATSAGIPVFNAPYSSTRSVAELTLGTIIMLTRRAAHKSMMLHQGSWDKSLSGAQEIRDKTVGIIGYGHIGQQVGILCEAVGMRVVFYDVQRKLPLGRAQTASSIEEVLKMSDFVSLHIPGGPGNINLFNHQNLSLMKKGAFLLNMARGNIVDLESLAELLKSGHLGGAAIDVFPVEPTDNKAEFETVLKNLPNVILTPHIGGNTEEAQKNIGLEVANTLISFIDRGLTAGAVNFPEINLPHKSGAHRILNIHKNQPGVLAEVNKIVSSVGANIEAQQLNTYDDIGYLVMDINKELSEEVKNLIEEASFSIKTRILF